MGTFITSQIPGAKACLFFPFLVQTGTGPCASRLLYRGVFLHLQARGGRIHICTSVHTYKHMDGQYAHVGGVWGQ